VAESDERFINEALELAQRSLDEDEMPIGAVVVLDDEVVGSGYWRYKPDGLLDHSDLVALRAAEKDPRVQGHRRDTALYVTLEPCLMCFGAAMSFGIGRIVFALESPFDGASAVTTRWQPQLGFPPPGYQIFSNPEVIGGVCRDASLRLMPGLRRAPSRGCLVAGDAPRVLLSRGGRVVAAVEALGHPHQAPRRVCY
jgi:tRNA(adenine34) deaminase